MRIIFCVLIFWSIAFNGFSYTQKDSLSSSADTSLRFQIKKLTTQDSAFLAQKKQIADSLTWYYLKPDPARSNPFVEKLLKEHLTTDKYLLNPAPSIKIKKSNYGLGEYLPQKITWFFPVALLLILLFGLVRIFFNKEVETIFKAFFDNRMLAQINKEENALVSWQYLFLYIIFSFTVGLFMCLAIYRLRGAEVVTEISTLLLLSLIAFIIFGLKIFVLRFLGFVFEIQKLVKDYTNIIYLTYFNALFVLLPIVFCLSLISIHQEMLFIWICGILFCAIVGFQFVRITINILINYRLSKFYLILYLCALEFCPVLIFAKIINTSL